MPSATATASGTPCTRLTNTIVATIAPGPASSGVPSGTKAMLTPSVRTGSVSARSVSSSKRDEQQQQPAGALQRGQRHVQVAEDALAEDGERRR